jgi:hypothetical protein
MPRIPPELLSCSVAGSYSSGIVLWAAMLASSRVLCSERARANEPEIRQAGLGTRDSG